MIKRVAKIGSNTQHNFNASSEIIYWAKKYNTSVEDIQHVFEANGNSISKTLEALRQREEAA